MSHAPAAAVDPAADLTQPLIAASTPVNWLLQIETGDAAGSIYPLTDPMVAGRGQDADILLLSKQISRRHARFALADGGPAVEDLESRNGTYVNGRPVLGQQLLLDGDEVRLHDVVIRIRQRGQHAA